jgi:hypothetical protein
MRLNSRTSVAGSVALSLLGVITAPAFGDGAGHYEW